MFFLNLELFPSNSRDYLFNKGYDLVISKALLSQLYSKNKAYPVRGRCTIFPFDLQISGDSSRIEKRKLTDVITTYRSVNDAYEH